MLPYRLACQDCGVKFVTIGSFKQHVRRKQHQQQVAELFQTDEYQGQVYFASILVLEYLARKPTNTPHPIVGLCLVTLCVSPEWRDTFYLCHSCEEKCGSGQIIDHLLSADHLSNYYSYTDPDVLSFSWMPNMDMLNLIRPLAVKEMDKNGPGVLRVLDMPKSVSVKLKRSGYSKVMQALTQTDRLAECIRADRPERMTIQEYHRDPNRKHPLLGLQHLVEYCCEGHDQRRSYLCQLCRLPVPSRRVIKHTISFDHLYWYFKVCHPSTLLMKDCYKEYSCRFISMILDLANQAQDISQSANKEIQQVVLEPAVFSSVEFSVYTEALRKLQTIRRDLKEGSLKTSITPGDKLVPFSEGSKITKDVTMTTVAEAVPMETKSSPEKTYVTPTAVETVATASTAPVVTTATSQRGTCRLHCQDCNVVCEFVSQYKLHVRHWKHKKMLGDIFGPGDEDSKACIPSFTLYEYFRNPERTEPIIGVCLLVMCVSTECWKTPFYLCHTCQEIIPAHLVMTHLTSILHLRRTLMYQSPQCLPFGWGTEMGLEVLKTLAWEEERVRGERDNVLKVFDIPASVFHSIKMSSYSSAMKRLKNFHRYLKVDRPLTFSAHLKNKDRRIPMLGLQFLVQYSVTRAGPSSPGWGFLCLLCERKLSDGLSIAHIHSYEHITTFLERAHPGSVKEVEESDERRSEILLDLAQQAEKIHAMGRLQFMMLQRYIGESVIYERALVILKAIKKRGNMGELMPLLPPGKKLVPSSSIRDQSQATLEPAPTSVGEEKQTRKETDKDNETEMDREATPETIQMTQETGVEVDKRIGKETCSDPSTNTGRETKRKTSKDTGRDTGRETSKGTGRETSKGTGGETSKGTGGETSKGTGGETSKDTGGVTITKASQETRKDSRSRGKDKEAEKIIKEKEMETDKKETSTETVKKLGSKTRNMTVHETSKDTGKTTSTENVKENERETSTDMERQTCRAVSIVASRASNRETKRKHGKKPETCKTPEKKTNTQTVKEKTKGTPPPISSPTSNLWDFLKRQNREAVIGLSALIECHSHGQSPLYLCQVCECKVFQNGIIVHVTTDCHRLSYLRSLKTVIVPKGNQLHKKLRRAALKLENTMGYGEAEVAELDAHTYNFVAERSFPIGLNIVMKVINGDPSPDPRLLVSLKPPDPSPQVSPEPPDPSPQVSPDPSPQVSEVSNPTMTSTALWSYLNASTRTQPVIGVSMLTELPDRHGDYFLCRCCSHRMFTSSLIGHLISARHRYHYIKLVYPELAADWPVSPELTVKAGPLHEELRVRAAELEAQEGLGQPTVVKREPAAGDTTTTEGTAQQSQNSSPLTVKEEPVDSTVPSQPPRGEKRNKRRSNPVVGVNFLVQVSHRRRKQYYCQLCSVRMKHAITDHMTSLSHRHNYVRLKYPGWTSSPVEMEKKLFKMAVHLEKVDRDAGMGMQKVEVEADEYKELLSFPVEEGVSKLQAIIRRQQEPCDLRHTAPSTNHNPEDLRQTAPLSNPDAAQCPAQGMCGAESRETEGVCPLPVSLSEENDQTPQRLLVQISVFLGEDQEPLQVPSPFLQDQPSLTSIPLPISTPPPPSLSPSNPFSTSLSTVAPSTSPSLSSSIPSHTPSLSTEKTRETEVSVSAPLSALRSSTHLKDWETCLSPEWWERKSPECRETQMLLEIPDRHTLLEYSGRDRQADYSERDRQADYSERDRQADYLRRNRQADYLRRNRETEYLASQSLHQTTEHWVTGQVTSMDTMLYSTPTEPDEDQEHTHRHGEHTHQHGEHTHFEQAPASWLSVPEVYLLPDTPAAKRVVGPSHLSKYLKVKGLHNTEPIIGLSSVVECRGISQATFFICVSCAETLSSTHICEHIISTQHQQCYMFSQYSPMRCDWLREQQQPPSPQLLRKVASALSQLEVDLDAQVMLLDQMWYNLVQSAPFHEAMYMLQEQNQNALRLHTASRHQLCPPVGPDPATEQGFDQNHRVMDKLTMDQIEPHHPLQTADTVAGKLTGDQLESGQCIQTADRRPDNQNPDQPQLSQSSERTEMVPEPIRAKTPHNSEPIRDKTPQNIEPIRAQMPKNSDPINSQTPQNTEPKRAWMPQNSSEPHLDQDDTVIIKQEPVDPKVEPQTQPEVDPLKGVCEVEYQGTVLGHSQEMTRIGGATENSLHPTKTLRDSVNSSLPLVGLSAVIECCSDGQVSFYLCVSCGSKIEKALLISHVLKYRHRQLYLTKRYPWYFLGVVPARGLAEQSRLMQIANEVEEQNHDEPGTLQEVILAPADFDEIKRMLFDKAVSRLQEICREQNQTELLTTVTSKPEPKVVKQEIVECQVVSHQAVEQFLPPQRCRRNTGKRCSNVEGSEVRGQQQVKKRKVSSPSEGHIAPVICLSSPEVTKSSDTHTVNQTHTITPSPTQSNTKPKLTPSCTHSDSQTKLKPSCTHPKPNSTAPEYTRPKLPPHSATKPSSIPADSLTVAKESSSKKPTHTLCKPTHTLSNPPKTLFTSSHKLTDKHSDKNESQKHTEKAKPTRTHSERTHRNRTHTRKHSDLTHTDRTKHRHSDRKHTNRHSDHSRDHTKRHNRSSSRSSKAPPRNSPSESPLLSPYSPAAFYPTRATSAASLTQVKPSQPSCLVNKQLSKQSRQPTKRPPNPTSAARPLQTQANPPNNTSYPHLHPARTGPRTPPPGPMTPQPPAIPPCLTPPPPPPPQPDPVHASGVKKTSIVDCDQFVEYFVSLLRSPHFPPALTTPERAGGAEAHTRATGPNPGGEEMRGDSKGHAIAIVAALPNPLKRKLSLQEPENRDPWNYESRQFTPNFQNPNPNFQNPNPNFQSVTPTANATLAQGGYTGGVTVSSSPNPTDPQPPEILPGSTYPGSTYPGYTYPTYTYPGSGYAGVVSVSQFTSNSPINPIPSPSNTQSQARWSGGNWGTGYPGAGYVTTGQAGTSYPGAVSSGRGAGYPGVLLYPEMGYSDMDYCGQAYPRSGTGLGSAGTVMPPGSLYSTTPSPANPSYLALTQPSFDPASYSAWTATVTGVAIETSTAEYLPRPQ